MMNEVRFSKSGHEIYLQISRDVANEAISPQQIKEKFAHSEYSNHYVEDHFWDSLVKRIDQERNHTPDIILRIKVAEARHARLRVNVSDDTMEATATAHAPYGGNSIDTKAALDELREKNITHGVSRKAIDTLIKHTQEGEPGSPLTITIARGKEPTHGKDTQFKPLVDDLRMRTLKPKEVDKHRVDMRDFGTIASVKTGTPILERIPYTLGVNGYTVTGQQLPAQDGKDKPLQEGRSTTTDPDNPNLLLATTDGLPSFVDNTAHIDDILMLGAVDVSTGHVKYDGSVVIDGNIEPGMRVISTGDITVNGYVDSAYLKANGNITVTKGVIGRQIDERVNESDDILPLFQFSAELVSDASIWVSYCQYATLQAALDIHVQKQATHCRITTPEVIHVGGEGEAARGKVVGGIIDVQKAFYVGQLGAPAGTKTRVHFNTPLKSNEQIELESAAQAHLSELAADRAKLSKAKQLYHANPEAFPQHYETTLIQANKNIKEKIRTAQIHLEYLQQNEVPVPPVYIYIMQDMHAGAEFIVRERIRRFDERHAPTRVILRNGRIDLEF